MAGRGPAPKDPAQRVRRNKAKPVRGEVTASDSVGWQHGERPDAPDGLMQPSLDAWKLWLGSWFAAHWIPEDVPGLRQVIRLYDQVERGEFQRAGELRMQMDTYGITPKGQQDRRWTKPKAEATPAATPLAATGTYGHLRSVPNAVEGSTP